MRKSLLLALPALGLLSVPLAAGMHFGILGAVDSHLGEFRAQILAAQTPAGPLGTATASPSITPTPTVSPTFSVSPSFTATKTLTPTLTASPSFSVSPSFTATKTITPTPTASPSFSPSPSFSATPTGSPSPTLSPSVSPSPTFSATRTASPTGSATPTRTGTPAYTPTVTPTPPAEQDLWIACGVAGTFLGGNVSNLGQFDGSLGSCTAWGCQAVANALTTSTQVTSVQANGGGGTACAAGGPWVYDYGLYTSTGTVNASAYRSGGHLRFDLMLGAVAPNSLSVSVGTFLGGSNPWVTLNPASYNSAGFTAVSVPISGFNPDPTAALNLCFLVSAGFSSPPAQGQILYYVDNVRWTGN